MACPVFQLIGHPAVLWDVFVVYYYLASSGFGMKLYLRLVSLLPVSKERKLSMRRKWLQSEYAKDIKAAQKNREFQRASEIESARRMELDFHDEEEDEYITNRLLDQARKFKVPIPRRYNPDNTESDHWYEGLYTAQWYLTSLGVSALRSEIRKEQKARHEIRAQWVVWLSGLTGLVGAATGLVALLVSK